MPRLEAGGGPSVTEGGHNGRARPPADHEPRQHAEEVEMDAVTQVPVPRNEPVHSYAPGSPERASAFALCEAMLRRAGAHRSSAGGRGA